MFYGMSLWFGIIKYSLDVYLRYLLTRETGSTMKTLFRKELKVSLYLKGKLNCMRC